MSSIGRPPLLCLREAFSRRVPPSPACFRYGSVSRSSTTHDLLSLCETIKSNADVLLLPLRKTTTGQNRRRELFAKAMLRLHFRFVSARENKLCSYSAHSSSSFLFFSGRPSVCVFLRQNLFSRKSIVFVSLHQDQSCGMSLTTSRVPPPLRVSGFRHCVFACVLLSSCWP